MIIKNHQKLTYKEQQYAEAGEISKTFAPTWDIWLFSLTEKIKQHYSSVSQMEFHLILLLSQDCFIHVHK